MEFVCRVIPHNLQLVPFTLGQIFWGNILVADIKTKVVQNTNITHPIEYFSAIQIQCNIIVLGHP